MKLLIRTLLTAIIVLASTAPATAGWRREALRFSHGDGWSDAEVHQTIRAAVAQWPVPGGFAQARDVAACESGFDEFAYSNGNAGVFQLRYWQERRAAYNRAVGDRLDVAPSWKNARSNVAVAVRFAHLYGWSAWSCA